MVGPRRSRTDTRVRAHARAGRSGGKSERMDSRDAFGDFLGPSFRHHLSALRNRESGDHAHRCVPHLVPMHRLRRDAAAQAGRLLRVLLVRLDAMPARPGRARGRCQRRLLRVRVLTWPARSAQTSRDWLGNRQASLLAWWIPQAAILAGLLVPPPLRAVVWIVALAWMGTACLLNAGRCGRTHCRYTGPFYLAMTAPVLVLASGVVSVGFYGWLALAILILAGGKIIWWATERAWGKFSQP